MKKYLVALITLLIPVGLLLFGNTLNFYFVSDDFVWLLHAKHDTLTEFSRYLFDSQGFFYRPFTKMYFYGMWRWFGVNPYPYHVVNVLLHCLNSIFVYLLSFSLLRLFFKGHANTKMALFSFVSALLFFVHPIHQENILWISAVTELFPALFLFSALYLFVRQKPHTMNHLESLLFFLCFALGLMSHEYAVIFPALIFITDYFIAIKEEGKVFSVKKIITTLKAKKGLYGGLALTDVLYLFLRAQANSHWSGGDYSYNLAKLPFNFVGNFVGYVGLNTIGVQFIYFYQSAREIMRNNVLLAGLLLVLFVIGVFYIFRIARRNRDDHDDLRTERFVLYLFVFFILGLLPFLGLGGIAERYLYLPSFAFILFLSLFLYWIIRYFDVPTKQYIHWYWAIFLLIAGIYFYSAKTDQADWKTAGDFVHNRLEEFSTKCDSFTKNESLSRVSPPNRVGRAWVFQVGYEQGANVLCDKNITILLK